MVNAKRPYYLVFYMQSASAQCVDEAEAWAEKEFANAKLIGSTAAASRTHSSMKQVLPARFSLAEILVQNGTAGGMAPPADASITSLLGWNVLRAQFTREHFPREH